MAACKIDDEEFLIFNGGRVVYWKGTMEAFGRHYHRMHHHHEPMTLIPHVGVSRYFPPKYDIAVSKFLLQARHMTDPNEMEALNIHRKYPAVAQAD
jgi:hypothetical protein